MVTIINALISKVGSALQWVILLLPQSPFNFTYNIDNKFIKQINYILPFSQAVAHLETVITAVVIYYGLRVILKWVKAAGN
jgi:hypothetical protein